MPASRRAHCFEQTLGAFLLLLILLDVFLTVLYPRMGTAILAVTPLTRIRVGA